MHSPPVAGFKNVKKISFADFWVVCVLSQMISLVYKEEKLEKPICGSTRQLASKIFCLSHFLPLIIASKLYFDFERQFVLSFSVFIRWSTVLPYVYRLHDKAIMLFIYRTMMDPVWVQQTDLPTWPPTPQSRPCRRTYIS